MVFEVLLSEGLARSGQACGRKLQWVEGIPVEPSGMQVRTKLNALRIALEMRGLGKFN